MLPVLILLQQHLLCTAVGPKNSHEDLGVCSRILHISGYHCHLIDNLTWKDYQTSNNTMLPQVHLQLNWTSTYELIQSF